MSGGEILFMDGSSKITQMNGERLTGSAVVRHRENREFEIVASIRLPSQFSAQAAELVVLIIALEKYYGDEVMVYSDAAYGTSTVHAGLTRWKRRGYLRADGTLMQHATLLDRFIKALQLPAAIAIVKCTAHTKRADFISHGNKAADEEAKRVATSSDTSSFDTPYMKKGEIMDVIMKEGFNHLPKTQLMEIQGSAPQEEQELWKWRGSSLFPSEALWRQDSTGKLVTPVALLRVALEQLHYSAHVTRESLAAVVAEDWIYICMLLTSGILQKGTSVQTNYKGPSTKEPYCLEIQ